MIFYLRQSKAHPPHSTYTHCLHTKTGVKENDITIIKTFKLQFIHKYILAGCASFSFCSSLSYELCVFHAQTTYTPRPNNGTESNTSDIFFSMHAHHPVDIALLSFPLTHTIRCFPNFYFHGSACAACVNTSQFEITARLIKIKLGKNVPNFYLKIFTFEIWQERERERKKKLAMPFLLNIARHCVCVCIFT